MKGFTTQSKRCAMCRREVPEDFLQHPDLLEKLDLQAVTEKGFDDEGECWQWMYEGRNGWWEYEERLVGEIEEAFRQSKNEHNLDDGTLTNNSLSEFLIAGYMYVIDFNLMVQFRKDNPNRKRRIKRDQKDNIHTYKGVAGLRKNN